MQYWILRIGTYAYSRGRPAMHAYARSKSALGRVQAMKSPKLTSSSAYDHTTINTPLLVPISEAKNRWAQLVLR